jgi:vacuolar protein sorting-associated protein 13A/C
MLNLPFKVKYSRIGCLKLIIPWKSLTSSKIEVLLEGLEVVIAELPEADWECKNTKIVERRKQQIESLCESVLADFLKKTDKDK